MENELNFIKYFENLEHVFFCNRREIENRFSNRKRPKLIHFFILDAYIAPVIIKTYGEVLIRP